MITNGFKQKHSLSRMLMLLGALLIASNILFAQAPDKYTPVYDSLRRIGQTEKMFPYLLKDLKAKPKDENILRWLGYLYIENNQLELGEKYYKEALAVNAKCARCYVNLGRIYAMQNNLQKADEYLDKAIAADPKEGDAHIIKGQIKEAAGDPFEAVFEYNKAIALEPGNPDYYVKRGLCNANAGYFATGLSDLNKAISLASNSFVIYYHRSTIYLSKNKYEEALADINTAIRLDSNQYILYQSRGNIYSRLKDSEKAIADFSKAIAVNPDDYLSYHGRGSEKYALEDMDGVCADFRSTLEIINRKHISDSVIMLECQANLAEICDPGKASYYYQRGIGLYNLGQYQQALAMYTKGLQRFPGNIMITMFMANTYSALKEYQKALSGYLTVLENKESFLSGFINSPRFAGASKETISSYRAATLASLYQNIAQCHLAMNHYEEALEQMNKAIQYAEETKDLGPDFEKHLYYNTRGDALLLLGKYREAISDYDKCLRINSSVPMAYINRALARINLISQVQSTSFTLRGAGDKQTISTYLAVPLKYPVKGSDENVAAALADCDKAIEADNKSGYAFYIRGQIKMISGNKDYCSDLLQANVLGYAIERELMEKCK